MTDAVKTYTAFVRQENGQGTTWISDVQGENIDQVRSVARIMCAADWDCGPSDVVCIGLAEGSVEIAFWED